MKTCNKYMLEILFYTILKKWASSKIQASRDNTEKYYCPGLLKNSTIDEQVDVIHCIIVDDRRLIVLLIVKSIGITSGSVVKFFKLDRWDEQVVYMRILKSTGTRQHPENSKNIQETSG